MYDYHVNELNMDPDEVPLQWATVEAEVLRTSASLEVRRQHAGIHQANQHDAHQGSDADVFAAFLRACNNKRLKLKVPNLSDNEVFQVLQQMGLDREGALEANKQQNPDDKEKEKKAREKVVCSHPNVVVSNLSFCHRSRT